MLTNKAKLILELINATNITNNPLHHISYMNWSQNLCWNSYDKAHLTPLNKPEKDYTKKIISKKISPPFN